MKTKKIKKQNIRNNRDDMIFLTVSELGNIQKAQTEKEIENAMSENCIVVCNDIYFKNIVKFNGVY